MSAERGEDPPNESCPATRDARGIAPIPCALPLGHAGEHRSKGGTTWAEIVPPFHSLGDPVSGATRWTPKVLEDRHPWLRRYHDALAEGYSMSEAVRKANDNA